MSPRFQRINQTASRVNKRDGRPLAPPPSRCLLFSGRVRRIKSARFSASNNRAGTWLRDLFIGRIKTTLANFWLARGAPLIIRIYNWRRFLRGRETGAFYSGLPREINVPETFNLRRESHLLSGSRSRSAAVGRCRLEGRGRISISAFANCAMAAKRRQGGDDKHRETDD